MKKLRTYLLQPLSIAPLASFRVLFGLVMCVSVVRFMLRGWVTELYVEPRFFFSYYGFEWVKPLGAAGMYVVFGVMALAALMVALGAFYRIAAPAFFLTWTYVELLDVTNYLNHYYFVSLAAFLLMLLPAHRSFSVDVWRRPELRLESIPRWMLGTLRFQLGVVYCCAGLAKVNSDWLLHAQPLRIWLSSKTNLPLIGGLFKFQWVAFAFAWMGCLYDLFVPFFLVMRRTRPYAYAAVIGFHLMTWWLFPIGMFPFIMILGTLVFFPGEWHLKWQGKLAKALRFGIRRSSGVAVSGNGEDLEETKTAAIQAYERRPAGTGDLISWLPSGRKVLFGVLAVHIALQVLIPFRYLLYPKDLFWHEQGFRFSWRVMLMEKAGYAIFHVRDPKTGRETEVNNLSYLRPNQERMMATQPDLILQFAHFLEGEYKQQGIEDPEVYAEVYATLNGRGSRPFTDRRVDLTQRSEGFAAKDWILPMDAERPIISEGNAR